MLVQESFVARPVAANGTLTLTGAKRIGGFTADIDGSLTLTINGVAVLTACPVTAGVYLPLPYEIVGASSLTLSGGARGCAAVA